MDWDDETFSRDDFRDHLDNLGILANHDFDSLLPRTSATTRTGNEFSFKPTHLAIGALSHAQLYRGFESPVERQCLTPQALATENPKPLPSSFWIRFCEEWFQIRASFSGYSQSAFKPYEGRILFRDVVQGGLQLRSLYRKDEDRVSAQLTIRSRRPLRFKHHLPETLKIGQERIYDRHSTEADFSSDHQPERYAGIIHAVGDPRLVINPGLWLVHRVTLDVSPWQYKLLWMCMIRLRLINLPPDIAPSLDAEFSMPLMPRWSLVRSYMEYHTFEVRYLIEALLSHDIVSIPEVEQLSAAIQSMPQNRRSVVLAGLFLWNRRGSIGQDLLEVARRLPSKVPPADHLMTIRRCLITPTRCILNPPTEETSSSLLRQFKSHIDRFLRVQFVDDDGDFPITGETLVIDDKLHGTVGVFARVRRALKYGLSIAGCHYTFLCFSESQAREHACWMISEEGDFTVKNVLRWIGDLSEERVVAKHAARHSLALSTTRAIKIDVKITRSYPDICRNGYTFTDGAGHCTQKVADEAARILGHTTTPVSAFQYRDGGVKGVLCVVEDPTLHRVTSRVFQLEKS